MKSIFSKTAVTLIELIVALVLVSIVLLGIVSINLVLSNNGQDFGQRYLVRSQTQTTLNHILNNASLAIGSSASDAYGNLDQGILIGAGAPPGAGIPNSFCIHQQGTSTGGRNITGSLGDIWLCYTYYPSTSATPYQIYWCTSGFSAATGAASHRGAAVPCAVASSNFLGTAYSVSYLPYTATNGFSVTINNCLNNSATGGEACTGSGTSDDMANNPEVQLTGSVFPTQDGSV